MARYDVYPNPSGRGYLVDLQTDLLDIINTRVVAPLVPASSAPALAGRLNPVFLIEGGQYVMITQSLAAVPAHILDKPVANLSANFAEITNAVDMVFQGF